MPHDDQTIIGGGRPVLGWPARKNRDDNPFQSLMSDALARRGWSVNEFTLPRALTTRRAVWHWHWIDSQLAGRLGPGALFRYLTLRGLLVWSRLIGAKIVVTAHNISPHDEVPSRLSSSWQRALDRHTSAVHFLSYTSLDIVTAARPLLAGLPYVVTRHGDYRSVLPTDTGRKAARETLTIPAEAYLVVTFGKLKRYKGVDDLGEAFRAAAVPGSHLLIAGRPEDAQMRDLVESWGRDEQVTVIARHLDQSDLALVVAASDLVVLPYRAILNSGSALLALSAGRPVLVPAIGSLTELAEDVGGDWVRTYDGQLTAGNLANAMALPAPTGVPDLSAYGWAGVAEALDGLYRRLL